MATYIPITDIPEQFFDSAGDPDVGGSLEFYLAGTTTATDGFSDNIGTSIGVSIVLNSLGYPETGGSLITLFRDQSKALKIVLLDAAAATIWTMDDIPAVASFDQASSDKLDLITVTVPIDLDTISTSLDNAYLVDGSVALTEGITIPAGKFLVDSTTAGITASITQTQLQGLIISGINEVSVCANDNDTITLPDAVAGMSVTVINNGANILQIFPYTDDSIDAGAADASTTLAAGKCQIYKAKSTVVWESILELAASVATGSTGYGTMYDQANTDAFVINATDDHHSYHTNGMLDGGSSGWTFDAGGAGTPVPIASIADGADTGVDIEVTTTGNHGLATGDIISQTGLTSPVYTDLFVVKAIISGTQYEVAAVYTATDNGFMDSAATLTCDVGSDGTYIVDWAGSSSAVTSSDIFDCNIHLNATELSGSTVRIKFGTGGDIGPMSMISIPFVVVAGDKVSFGVLNTSGTGNITFFNMTTRLNQLV
jgi:hypothetical protein